VLASKLLPGGAVNVIYALRKMSQHLAKDKHFKKVAALLVTLIETELRPGNAAHFYDALSVAMRDERRVHMAALRPSFVKLFRAVHLELEAFSDEGGSAAGSKGGGDQATAAAVGGSGSSSGGSSSGGGSSGGSSGGTDTHHTSGTMGLPKSMLADVALWVNSAVSHNLMLVAGEEADSVQSFECCWPYIRSAAALAAAATGRRGAPKSMLIARLYDVLACLYPLFKHVGLRERILTAYASALRSSKKIFEKHQRKELETFHSTMLARR
jgi:hypothetical protein